KIDGRLRWPADLGPNPGITRLQRAIPQFGPVGADRGIKRIAARRIDRVIDLGNPLYVRAETRPTREVEGDVNAEPAGRRHGIDKAPKRCASGQRKIDAPAKEGGRDRVPRYSSNGAGECGRIEPGRV